MNEAPARPRTRFLKGNGYWAPPQKTPLSSSSDKDRLWKLPDLTGLWTLFEAAHDGQAHSPLENLRFPTGPWTRFEEAGVGRAPTTSHSPLPARRLKGKINRNDTQTVSVARKIVT